MLLDAAVHASGASKKLISPSYLVRQIFGHDTKKYKGQNQKNNVQADISQKLTQSFFRRPLSNCLLCWVGHAVVRSWQIGGLADSSRAPA